MSQMETPEQPKTPEILPFIIDGPPWEKKHELGFFVAFIETIKAFLLRPAATFSVMRRNAGISDALVYTVAIQVFTFLWTFTLADPDTDMFLPQNPELRDMLDLPENFSQIMVLAYPISVILLQFLSAFAVHLSLKWRDLQTYDFTLIFRMFAYASGTASLLILLPIVGGFFSMGMTIYLGYMGLRTIYAMDVGSFMITAFMALFLTIGLYLLSALGMTIFILIVSTIF
ncbi:MAG: hypothetical protein HN995_10895 [Candidatus Marinimicrobia bacterium]|jgi:hypothetical protein|nr:hypothetical protein [Candidatus Neomarinimicrobiota bacterium]MBT3576716.1 hypothetical protein [Candidatus Neomarinimicrobiota bacterium]MBT3951853.1 hypothetical protein [Candidatus Neomarinimicrobiota bacterium]MBT5234938.1 hypothetical protein [Candidatus Neomarinimicrobiota bacterium]MBT5786929.1 hypothetical protein [Candidatus Neomarinimicrobiota bacterium]